MSEQDLVSVVIPAWRAEKTLGDTLDSVLRQTWTALEIIVVDDASPDGTLALAQSYAQKDHRIRVIALEQNGGVSASRNCGVREAHGEWIAFLDSDDTWMRDKTEKQMEIIRRFPDTSVVYTGYGYMTAEGRALRYTFRVPETADFSYMLRRNVMSTSGILLRRELLTEHPFRSDIAHEDLFEWLTILQTGAKARGVQEKLHMVRLTGAASRSGNKAAAAKNRMKLYEELGLSRTEAVRNWLAYAYYAGIKYLSLRLSDKE